MTSSPAFLFYPNDWLSSTHIAGMSLAEEGAYHRLLCYEWNDPDCSLPDDDKQLAVLSRLNDDWFKDDTAAKIRSCFVPYPDHPGRLINKRLASERLKRKQWADKSRKGGLTSGTKRKNDSNFGRKLANQRWQKSGESHANAMRSDAKQSQKKCEAINGRECEANANSSFTFTITKPASQAMELDLEMDKETIEKKPNGLYRFDEFWKLYPKRKDRGHAETAWKKLSYVIRDKIILLLPSYEFNSDPQYIPLATTWLNGKRWEDEKFSNLKASKTGKPYAIDEHGWCVTCMDSSKFNDKNEIIECPTCHVKRE